MLALAYYNGPNTKQSKGRHLGHVLVIQRSVKLERVMLYDDILRSLQDHDIRYLLVGGIAVNLYGFARATADLDLLLAMDDQNLLRFVGILQEGGWRPRVPVRLEQLADSESRHRWITEKHMQVFTVVNPARPMEELDILLESGIDFDAAFDRRQVLSAEGMEISLVSLEDLMVMKRQAGRERDYIDLKALEQIKQISDEQSDETCT